MAIGNNGFKDKRTKDKIDLHLRDINDKITEKDIENVKTDVTLITDDSSTDEEAVHEADDMLSKKEREDKNKEDGNNSNNVQTPWNMLD